MPIAIPFAEDDGRQVLVPTAAPDGTELDEAGAIEQYKKSGRHFGKFDTSANAQAYAAQLEPTDAAAAELNRRELIRVQAGQPDVPPTGPTEAPAAPTAAADAGMPGVDVPYGAPATVPPETPAPTPPPAAPGAPAPGPPPLTTGVPASINDPSNFQQRWADVESRLPANRPDLLLRAQHALRTQMAAEYADELHLRQQGERAQKDLVRSAENEFIADAFSNAPKLSAQSLSVDKRFDTDPEARLRMIALKTRLAERPLVDPVVSSTTMHELMRGIAAGDIDRGQVLDAFNAKPSTLSETHFNFLLKQLDDIRTPEGLKVAKDIDKLLMATKGSITKSNPLMGNPDASGDLNFGAFEEDIRRAVETMKRDKKSAAEISDYLNVKRFRDNPALLEPYQKTIQQSIQDLARALSRPPPPPPAGAAAAPPPVVPPLAPSRVFTAPIPPVPPNAPAGVQPRQPGESVGDYLKRTGGAAQAR